MRDNRPMVPMRMSSVFKSRWMALIWAAGILWFAYDFAGSAPQAQGNGASDVSGSPLSADDQNKVAQALGN
jgi:hypothetical protein